MEVFLLNAGEAVGVAHGRPLESDLCEFKEALFGARDPLGLEPVVCGPIVARRG